MIPLEKHGEAKDEIKVLKLCQVDQLQRISQSFLFSR